MSRELLQASWYVLHTKSRFENVVNDGLLKKSLEAFNPKIKVRSKRRDRRVMINVPLFPGYVFVKTDLRHHEYLEILKTVGVVRFVGNAGGPIPVMDEEIGSLKIMTETGEEIVTGTRFKKGDRIIVVSGPFAGVTGYFMQYRGQGRVVVNIDALGQFAAVNVDERDLEAVPPILL